MMRRSCRSQSARVLSRDTYFFRRGALADAHLACEVVEEQVRSAGALLARKAVYWSS